MMNGPQAALHDLPKVVLSGVFITFLSSTEDFFID